MKNIMMILLGVGISLSALAGGPKVISVVFTGSKVILSIVPNPVVTGMLVYTITGLSSDQKATVKVVDYTGKTLSTSTVSTLQNNRLNVGNLPAGLYKLVVTVNGTQLQKTFSKN